MTPIRSCSIGKLTQDQYVAKIIAATPTEEEFVAKTGVTISTPTRAEQFDNERGYCILTDETRRMHGYGTARSPRPAKLAAERLYFTFFDLLGGGILIFVIVVGAVCVWRSWHTVAPGGFV